MTQLITIFLDILKNASRPMNIFSIVRKYESQTGKEMRLSLAFMIIKKIRTEYDDVIFTLPKNGFCDPEYHFEYSIK